MRTLLSLYPANRVLPSADQARERHSGSAEFFPTPTNSGLSSSTIDLLSRSKTTKESVSGGGRHQSQPQPLTFDAAGSGSAKPVTVGAEDKGVDDVAGLERVEVLSFRQLPQHCDTIFAARGTQRAIGGHSDRVNVSSVSVVVRLELALRQLPNLGKKRSGSVSDLRLRECTMSCPSSGLLAIFPPSAWCSAILVDIGYSHRAKLSVVANIISIIMAPRPFHHFPNPPGTDTPWPL